MTFSPKSIDIPPLFLYFSPTKYDFLVTGAVALSRNRRFSEPGLPVPAGIPLPGGASWTPAVGDFSPRIHPSPVKSPLLPIGIRVAPHTPAFQEASPG